MTAVVGATETEGRVALVRTHQLGAATTGATAEWDWLLVMALGVDDTIGVMEYFDVDHEPAARRRFEELTTGPPAMSGDAPSSVTELLDPTAAAFASRDWEFVREHLALDVELLDRRSTVRSERTVGPDGIVELFRGFADVGFDTLDQGLVDVRGQHLALVRRTYRSARDDELEMLVVVETDEQHRAQSVVLFDPDDLVAARDELDNRWSRG